MKTSYLIQDLIKNSSLEMKQLIRGQFKNDFYQDSSLYSYADQPQGGSRSKKDSGGEQEEQDPLATTDEGLQIQQWRVYLTRLQTSVKEAKEAARKTNLQTKMDRANEYDQKVRAIIAEFLRIVSDLKRKYKKKYSEYIVIPMDLIMGGDSGGGMGQRRRGRGRGDAGFDLDETSEDRDFRVVPFAPFIDIEKLNRAGLVTEGYDDVKEYFKVSDFNIADFNNLNGTMELLKNINVTADVVKALRALQSLLTEVYNSWKQSLVDLEEQGVPENTIKRQHAQYGKWNRRLGTLATSVARDRLRVDRLIADSSVG